MIIGTDPERIGKLVGSMRESVRVLNEIRAMKEADFLKMEYLLEQPKLSPRHLEYIRGSSGNNSSSPSPGKNCIGNRRSSLKTGLERP